MINDLRARTVKGVRVTFATTVISGLIQAAVLLVLARLLLPYDYGLVAAGMIVIRPIQNILFSGLERAIIVSGALKNTDVRAIQGFSALVGSIAALIVATISLVLRVIPASHAFSSIVLALSPLMFITAMGVTARAQLRLDLSYGRLASADLAALVVSSIVSILAALEHLGAYSLAAGLTVQAAIQTVINIRSAKIGYRATFSWSAAKPVIGASVGISKTSILEVVNSNLPMYFIGGSLGPAPLGLYNRAYSLIQLPIELLMNSMSRVLFGGFAIVRDDLPRLRKGIQNLVEVGAATTIPLCFGMAAASPSLIIVLLGPHWTGSVPIIPWICVGTSFSMLAHLFASMAEATSRFNERFFLQLVTSALTVLSLFVGGHWGLPGYSAAFAFGGIVFFIGNILLTAHIVQLGPLEVISWTFPSLACGSVLVGLVMVVRYLLSGRSAPAMLAVEFSVCATAQLGMYAIFWRRTFQDVLRFSGLRAAT